MKMKLSPRPSPQPEQRPNVTFYGPDSTRRIKAINPNGFEVARFMISGDKKSFTLSKLTSPNTPPDEICTSEHKSFSSTSQLKVRGGTTLDFSMAYSTELDTPMFGRLNWVAEKGSLTTSRMKLVDAKKNVLATANTTKDELEFVVLAQGDDHMIECLLSGWVALVFHLQSRRKVNGAGVQVISTLAGA